MLETYWIENRGSELSYQKNVLRKLIGLLIGKP